MADDSPNKNQPISFTPKLVASGNFRTLYSEGMTLIEDVAAYLDGDGRAESRHLPREAALVYASESMRLTTRLMQLASWLLLQRAVNEGEITAEHARNEKTKVAFSAEPGKRGGPGWDELPERFRDYVEKGDRIFSRVKQIDKADRGETSVSSERLAAMPGSIGAQLARLKAAFGQSES
ncbi:MAG: DUF1465 family protein [Hyphomicrobiaceae bacterium]|nr:DUF1465 family protein [Hyphomicrobiaceae bacterium]MCC0024142.1 DUF1465 family protein [Hyphomicrobiaceae bacterium]